MMFQVTAETHGGKVMALRKGFATREAALDHPVKASNWAKVWVEEMVAETPAIEDAPPFPWTVEWTKGRAYVVDARGKRFASLLGTQKRREQVAEILYDLSDRMCGGRGSDDGA